MWENLVELYNTLSSNPVAASIVLTPLIAGLSFFLFKKLPLFLFDLLKRLFSTEVIIYQYIDSEAFQTGEYLLAKYPVKSLSQKFTLRSLRFIKTPILTIGNYSYFYTFINNIFVLVYRYDDSANKYGHTFILSFLFFTRNKEKVDSIFKELDREKELNILSDELQVFIPNRWGDNWKEILKKKKNYTPKTTSQKLVLDSIINYISQKDFDKLGVMLYGKPGCGKSNVIRQIVSKLGYRLYYINLSMLTDNQFIELVGEIKTPSVIVIEDIDCCDVTHDRSEDKQNNTRMVSLSTLLNFFDGIMSLDGQIVICTTNYYDKLDEALIRKSRFNITINMEPMTYLEILDYIAEEFKVSRSDVAIELGKRADVLNLPIASVSAACKETNNYEQAIEMLIKNS